ncbi:variant erythrocyte surface antigen-1 family protein [Babesia caballi]|uniref:Variant erythrocyte surface antigen-1 family protein n=1 Tax=Babesia caballi TaxID=5871 RepID=A0AAV4M196_BABCB|nr:variant erythrocyte surface antigen-1 family protein [Babesia caballi]
MSENSGKPLLDCPSNLKEAIDWILRVTGKDGQSGGSSDGTTELTKQVKKLLYEVENSDTKLGEEIKKVMNALGNGKSDLITKLADGLQQFIGYNGTTFNPGNVGQITGAGIAPSNIATHRLCDAIIAFTIGVLEGCKNSKDKQVRLNTDHRNKLDGVIKSLHEKYGQGPEKLQDVGEHIKSQLTKKNFSQTGIGQFVNDLASAFDSNIKTQLTDSAENVAQKVGDYLRGIFDGWVNGDAVGAVQTLKNLGQQLQPPNTAFDPNGKDVKNMIDSVKEAFDAIEGKYDVVQPILTAGKEEFVWHLEKAYVSYYPPSANWPANGNGQQKNCAQIFLGCIPLIYHCLTQFYWLCLDTKKRWDTYPFNGGALRNLMVALGYGDAFLGGSTGKAVMTSVATTFNELSSANDATSKPYPEFLNSLTTSFNKAFTSPTLTDQTIPALYHIARLYFRHQHGRNAGKPRPPSSIREMLYWLSGLQFSPQYDSLQSHISGVFRNLLGKSTSTDDAQLSLPVADSGSTKDSNTLSAFDLKGYLTMTCLYTPMVLGRLQGHGVSTESNEPYLHHLFGNGMSFAYPSGAALLSKLSEYAYALQFQLSFLTQQCFIHNGDGCGWRKCRFGSTVEPTTKFKTSVSSHLCHADCGTHSSGACQHDGPATSKCGKQNGAASPLQAFLTDNLKGFRRDHPGTSDHLASCSSKSMCHVPMGFKAEYLRESPGYGYHVFYPLLFYCSDHSRPLRLLSDKLHCISNYTPRSLGDMFGFYLHLCLQVFNKRSEDLSEYVTKLLKTRNHPSRAGLVIFEYLEHSIVELGSAVHGVVRHCHNRKASDPVKQIKHQTVSGEQCSHSHSQSPADLWSLFSVMDKTKNDCSSSKKCGAYLSPLTRSNGSTFGKSAAFASTYLSWVSYLSDNFKERLEGLLTDFTNITCTECKTLNGGTCNCAKGNHGTSNCQCDSVVSCSGVLPLFYEHGFNFFDVQSLSGNGSGNTQTKRNCGQFHSQLQTVITGDPLNTLLTTIDAFLYAIRWEFFSKLSGFWTIYTCLILYTFFFLLDTLDLRSHLKPTSSHTVPPIGLLTSGKPLPMTKLTYIGQ